MYDFRPVRNEVCVYLKYHLELAVSGIFERREGSNDTNLKFQPQIMEKLRLLTLILYGGYRGLSKRSHAEWII